jgi:hypothetical protein
MRDAEKWDTDLQHAIQLFSPTSASEPKATKALGDSDFQN